MYDLLIANGRVLDGTGSPWRRADVAVAGDKIVAIGHLAGREAAQVVDASGMFVCPGFIEEHCHSDGTFVVDPLAQSAVRQGMTTMVVGLCGMSAAPVADEMLDVYTRSAPLFNFDGFEWKWRGMGEYLAAVQAAKPSVNVVSLVGNHPVRAVAMGEASRTATADERVRMRELVAEALAEGARGLSVGLIYSAVFSETEEIVEIARALRPYGWAYHATIRDYGAHLLDAVREAIHVAETAEVPLVVAHMYPAGREYWGQADAAIELLERARDRGLETGYDVTPWPRGGGPMLGIVPAWARNGGHDATLERLRDPALRSRIGAEIEQGKQYSFGFGWDDMIICRTGLAEHRAWLGRSIGELARESGRTPPEAGLLMLLQDDGQTWIAPTNKCDEDVDALLRHPMGVPIADGFALAPEGPLAYQDRPNSYGTFPRVLGRYVRERGVLTWEQAVQKMTAIPASRVGLWDRGVLREGLAADIVVFDPDTVIERADYSHPQEYPVGIEWVVVNGQITVSPDGHTGARAGRTL